MRCARWNRRAGRRRCRAGGQPESGWTRPGPDLSVLHGRVTSPAGNVYNSLLSVVNSTASVKAVKVRFLEGKNSREVLDFNLFLSPKDVWTAGIVPMGAVSGTPAPGAGIITADKSCTLPADPGRRQGVRQLRLLGRWRAARRSTARRKATSKSSRWRRIDDSSDTAANVTHVGGVPPGCGDQTDALGASEARRRVLPTRTAVAASSAA